MSKRKNRNQSPASSPSNLDRARAEVDNSVPEPEEAADPIDEKPAVQFKERVPAPVVARTRISTSASVSRKAAARTAAARAPRKEEKHDMAYIRNRLAHPTRIVTEAQLRAEYGYVIRDLRSMGILAAALIAALVIIEKIL